MKNKVLKKLEIAVTKAMVIECTVPKPGNVSRVMDFPTQKFEDFLISGIELGASLPSLAARYPLGKAVLEGVKIMLSAQRGGNTHLGTIILLVPLLKNAYRNNGRIDFDKVQHEIKNASWKDTFNYVKAIRMTDVGSLPDIEGRLNVKSLEIESVVRKEKVPLYAWMLAGVNVNAICHEYTQKFELSQKIARVIREHEDKGVERTVLHGFFYALSEYLDNLVVGKKGLDYALWLKNYASELYASGYALTAQSAAHPQVENLFRKLREDMVNPGTTADLIVSALFLLFLDGWRM
ncbi:MAG: triphosphoribosyl-dephospho-CoA synthase [Thermoplasmata archaeon]